jgi:pimeloyl-ACP methyl ester carboxylesterase
MRRLSTLVLILLLVSANSLPVTADDSSSSAIPGACQDGTLPSGALWLICIPAAGWNGDVVFFAHGYVGFNEPIAFYHLEFSDGIFLPDLVQTLGYAFATTSYRQNGLAVREGADDIRELVAHFPTVSGGVTPGHTYITGVSQGGIITALLLEQSPELFSGGLAACGPIGNFRGQLNYFGDFHTLFNYFFPEVVPGTSTNIPNEVIENWDEIYVPAVTAAIESTPDAARELIRTSKAAIDPADPSTIRETILSVLWYNVFATNDAIEKLGGNPYNNIGRVYRGSSNDFHLNRNVERTPLELRTLPELAHYQTTGKLTKPLVTLHTVGDEIIPFWHQQLYRTRVELSGDGHITTIPILRYGHCNFTAGEVVTAFAILVWQVSRESLPNVSVEFDEE